MGLGTESFVLDSLPSHGANYYILKWHKLSSSGVVHRLIFRVYTLLPFKNFCRVLHFRSQGPYHSILVPFNTCLERVHSSYLIGMAPRVFLILLFFYQIPGSWQVVSDGKADFKLTYPVQARLSQHFTTSGAIKTNRSTAGQEVVTSSDVDVRAC